METIEYKNLKESDDLQNMFEDMERKMTSTTSFRIQNPDKRKDIRMAVEAFVRKYEPLVASVFYDYRNGSIDVNLLNMEQERSSHYEDIKDEYSSDYYLDDCGGYDVFKKWGGAAA